MTSSNSGLFAITLHVPDEMERTLRNNSGLRGLILDDVPGLEFLPPPWWEVSHTVRLGLIYQRDEVEPGAALE